MVHRGPGLCGDLTDGWSRACLDHSPTVPRESWGRCPQSLPFLPPILLLCQLPFVPHTRLNILTAGTTPPVPMPQSPTLASCLQPAAGCWLVPIAGR